MGCGSSKPAETPDMNNFFGAVEEPPTENPPSGGGGSSKTTSQATSKSTAGAAATSNNPNTDDARNGSLSPAAGTGTGSGSGAAGSQNDKSNRDSQRSDHRSSQSKPLRLSQQTTKSQRPSAFVAPPSSESFVVQQSHPPPQSAPAAAFEGAPTPAAAVAAPPPAKTSQQHQQKQASSSQQSHRHSNKTKPQHQQQQSQKMTKDKSSRRRRGGGENQQQQQQQQQEASTASQQHHQSKQQQQQHSKPKVSSDRPTDQQLPPPPPPPALSPTSAEANQSKSNHQQQQNNNSNNKLQSSRQQEESADVADEMENTARSAPRKLEDDDFSVQPSIDVEMRSVTTKTFEEVYKRDDKKLGYGAFAIVFIGTHRPTGAKYAIKQVDRKKMNWGGRDALKDEIRNLKAVRAGPNIVQLYEVYEEKHFCYLVTELMMGGELFDRIIEKKTFSEKEARSCCRCVLSALKYMHDRRVAHRDLKPENLLLADPKSLLPVKLADFGFAKTVEKRNGCRTLCGTPGYLAPEILERWPAYDVKCDVWSVGVILFLLLGGYLPFDDEDEDKVFDRTRNGQYDFRPQFWKHISNGAKDLVSQCLTINPGKRVSSTTALNHEWMTTVRESELASHQVDIDKIKTLFEAKKKMKAAVNTLVAANRLQQLQTEFDTYLDKRRGESIVSHFSYMTCGTRTGHQKFVEDSPSGKPFATFYTLGTLLGEGGHSRIFRAMRKSTKFHYAVKHVQTSKLDEKSLKTFKEEVASLRMLRGGPHIVRLFDVFMEPDDYYLIYEEMTGGSLLNRIVEKEVYSEREARQVCRIAFTAIDYCHKKKVAHRDIKPENFLLVEEGNDTSVKLADFAFAKKCTHEKSLKTLCGTAHYVAPEILDHTQKYYDYRCDMWSAGVFTYMLLGGYPPFEGVLSDLAKEIQRGFFEFHEEYWFCISQPAKELIQGLLVVDPNRRMSASDAMGCLWMQMDDEQLVVSDLSNAQESIRQNVVGQQQQKQKQVSKSNWNNKVKTAVNTIIAKNKMTSIAGMMQGESNLYDSVANFEEIIDEFEDNYIWGEQIGIGTFSVVHEVVNRQTNEKFAAKRVTRKDLHPSDAVALHDEVAALQQACDCEHIVKLYDVFDEPDFTYIVLECMTGGDLIDRIIEKRHYTEYDAKEVSRKLLLGVEYCHKKKIANRNLKPENLLLKAGSDTEVKISDFGYAKTVTFPNSLRTQCGTEGYVAPEILEHRPAYDVPCDLWSLGVIIYIVLGGYRPFRGEGEDVMRQIRYGEYKFHKRYWSHVSGDAKNLITRMLTVDPEKRITAKAALKCKWISANEDTLGAELSGNMEDLKNLRNAKSKLKGVVHTIIATNKLQSLGGLRAYQDF